MQVKRRWEPNNPGGKIIPMIIPSDAKKHCSHDARSVPTHTAGAAFEQSPASGTFGFDVLAAAQHPHPLPAEVASMSLLPVLLPFAGGVDADYGFRFDVPALASVGHGFHVELRIRLRLQDPLGPLPEPPFEYILPYLGMIGHREEPESREDRGMVIAGTAIVDVTAAHIRHLGSSSS